MSGKIDLSGLGATDGVLRTAIESAQQQRALEDAKRRLAGRNAVRPKDSREAGIIRAEARVEVRRTDDPNTVPPTPYLEVAVYSLMKPGNYRRVLFPWGSLPKRLVVQAAAGAACEELCEVNNDPFDPDQAARAAGDAYDAFVAAA